MRLEHEELRGRKRQLFDLSRDGSYTVSLEKQRELVEAGSYLIKELPNHIYKEDNILYQLALQTLSEEKWTAIKGLCDQIGYCCFTPADEVRKATITR